MFQNMKVDVIYHNVNTDFEMEFNLCGCCRMRLLTDKTPDKKALVHSLARAVSRSRIIIVVGNLFGEEGIVSLVGEAIKSGVSTIDNNLYGIKATEDVSVLKGSTPLITNEGFFGGCIVESGPQTMILLSKNRSVRKAILSSLIHPYIEELYASDLAADSKTEIEPVSELKVETPDDTMILEGISDEEEKAFEPVADKAAYEETETDVYEEVSETAVVEEAEEAADTNVVAGEHEVGQTQEETPEDIPMESDTFVLSADDVYSYSENDNYQWREEYEPPQRASKSNDFKWPILIGTIMLLVLLAVLCYCIFFVPSSEGVSAGEYIKDIFDTLFPASQV